MIPHHLSADMRLTQLVVAEMEEASSEVMGLHIKADAVEEFKKNDTLRCMLFFLFLTLLQHPQPVREGTTSQLQHLQPEFWKHLHKEIERNAGEFSASWDGTPAPQSLSRQQNEFNFIKNQRLREAGQAAGKTSRSKAFFDKAHSRSKRQERGNGYYSKCNEWKAGYN